MATIHPAYPIVKARITMAFTILRTKGYICHSNFECNQDYGFSTINDKHPGATKVIFYHKQDTKRFKETGYTHLSFAGNGTEIVDVLNVVGGVKVTWNGEENTRIKVSLK